MTRDPIVRAAMRAAHDAHLDAKLAKAKNAAWCFGLLLLAVAALVVLL